MKRWQIALLLVLTCGVSAAAGFWAGFREGWTIGVAADLAPRAVRSIAHLQALETGNPRTVRLGLEFDVDNALVWGYEVTHHPLRELWASLLDLDFLPAYERDLGRLAGYRSAHPSSLRAEMFDTSGEFARGARDVAARRDRMVQRYATKKVPEHSQGEVK